MKEEDFEKLLDEVTKRLGADVHDNKKYHDPKEFEDRVLIVMRKVSQALKIDVNPCSHQHGFPDIVANGFGVEVKSTRKDQWSSTGNSIFESMREANVKKIYVIFGKMGGMSSVRWGLYDNIIRHVRISHAPRFVVDMGKTEPGFFGVIKMSYEEFSIKKPSEKMTHVRDYARQRLSAGEKLWWLEDEHTVDLRVRRYSQLEDDEKKKMRAEAAILCPQVVAPRRTANKYDAAFHFLITYHGVLATRDMFSAGSVGSRDGVRGGNYVLKSLKDIEKEMYTAAEDLDKELFREYWTSVEDIPADSEDILRVWLRLADEEAKGQWFPSKELFKNLKKE